MELSYIEFDDPDDPQSVVNADNAVRFTVAPEGMVLAMPGGNKLGRGDQEALGKMLRMAYEQGKRVGRLVAEKEG